MPLPWSVWVYESSRLEGPLSWELDGERGHPTGRLLSLKKVVRRRGTIFFCFLLFMFTELFCSCCILVLPHVATLFLANALVSFVVVDHVAVVLWSGEPENGHYSHWNLRIGRL